MLTFEDIKPGMLIGVQPDGMIAEMRKYLRTIATVIKITKAGLIYVEGYDGFKFSLPLRDCYEV